MSQEEPPRTPRAWVSANLRLSPDMLSRLRAAAASAGVSMSEAARNAVEEWVVRVETAQARPRR